MRGMVASPARQGPQICEPEDRYLIFLHSTLSRLSRLSSLLATLILVVVDDTLDNAA